MKRLKKVIPFALFACIAFSTLPLSACGENDGENVLRIASWDEYICEGGEDSYFGEGAPLYEEFETWYKETYGKEVTVKYIPLQDNETMYNKIKMGDSYDLLCPSEYMIMKLAEEGYIQKLPSTFYDTDIEHNYYAKYVSPYIKDVFENGTMNDGSKWAEYTAGYMWGSTGFVYNPQTVDKEDVKSWNIFTNKKYERKITAKDNVRDSYFAGLGIYHEQAMLALKNKLESGEITLSEYKIALSTMMNDTSENTMKNVQNILKSLRQNVYGLETDEGKLDVVTGRFDISYQWSGDAVYTLDVGESEEINDEPIYLEYCIPDAASNLFFDGWVLMKDSKNVDAATAFINFLSIPQNVIRNMYYIGYTSCVGGEEVYEYVQETYGASEDEEDTTLYDLSYFFGEDHQLLTTKEQTTRQLFAQYPDVSTIDRLVVMKYFDKETNERANRMWNTIK
ncbi:MAG: extracellular solute-binding protein [Clostridiales bacterium]|nr:extracellular solute-binding protein [Clostridiales bacterium]